MFVKSLQIKEGDLLVSQIDTRNRKKGDFLRVCYNTPPNIGYIYSKNKFAEANHFIFVKTTEFASKKQRELFNRGMLNIADITAKEKA